MGALGATLIFFFFFLTTSFFAVYESKMPKRGSPELWPPISPQSQSSTLDWVVALATPQHTATCCSPGAPSGVASGR